MVVTALIVAMASNRVIGRDNQLPWRLPADLKYFKAVTMGKPIIMGRRTWESIGKPLPGRINIVVSRSMPTAPPGTYLAASLRAAIALARQFAVEQQQQEILVIGGAGLYAEALPEVARIYLTEVHAEPAGDVLFPVIDRSEWREVSRTSMDADTDTAIDGSFVVLERR